MMQKTECEGPDDEVLHYTPVPLGHRSASPSASSGSGAGQEFRKYGSRNVCFPQHENGCAEPGKFIQTFLILKTFSCVRKHIGICIYLHS